MKNDEANAVLYMLVGVLFLCTLFMAGSALHGMYNIPREGDIVQCNQILVVAEKYSVLDDIGMIDYYVRFENGQTLALYDYDDYMSFPGEPGTKIHPRIISPRMRIGATLDSWFVIDAVPVSGIQNACMVTKEDPAFVEPPGTKCVKPPRMSTDLWEKSGEMPFGHNYICWLNSTFGNSIPELQGTDQEKRWK